MMSYQDYIKSDCQEKFKEERENISDRFLEAMYNKWFLKRAVYYQERYPFDIDNLDPADFGVRVIYKRIYITVFWELITQMKAMIEDDGGDVITVKRFKNLNFTLYLKDEKKNEIQTKLQATRWETDKNFMKRQLKLINDYRNQIICHNFRSAPDLKMNLLDLEKVLEIVEEVLKIFYFDENTLMDRLNEIDGEMIPYIDVFNERIFLKG